MCIDRLQSQHERYVMEINATAIHRNALTVIPCKKERRCEIIANETTLRKRPNNTEIKN